MRRRALSFPVLVSALVAGILLAPRPAAAIQGCTLRDPDRDIRRLFPESTDYRSAFVALSERGGEPLLRRLAERLGDTLDPVYEAVDLPYAYYEVMKGDERVGYVFGVNQKGRYGGMQIILATDPDGRIRDLYYQKLSAPERKAFTAESFTKGFAGLDLADFYYHAGYEAMGLVRPEDRVDALASPAASEVAKADFAATLRGVKKALILHDLLWLGERYESTYQKVQDAVRAASDGAGK